MKLPQLTLRDLFWLVLVCALAVGWWLDHARKTDFPGVIDFLHTMKREGQNGRHVHSERDYRVEVYFERLNTP
jgi:hypothetical protein